MGLSEPFMFCLPDVRRAPRRFLRGEGPMADPLLSYYGGVEAPRTEPQPKAPNRRRTSDPAYATGAGTVRSTSVPAPTSLHNFNLPPIRLARSRIPGNPQ